jgi:hypothetical protein
MFHPHQQAKMEELKTTKPDMDGSKRRAEGEFFSA